MTCLWMFWKAFDGKTKEKLKDSLKLIWPLKYGNFLQTFPCPKLFLPLDRSSISFWKWRPVARASYQPQNAPALKCDRPRTSDTAIWASRIAAGPYFSALLPRACHFLTFCCTTAWSNSLGFASWPLGQSRHFGTFRHYNLNLWLCKLLIYQRITVLHFNDSPQVILAARFIWRWHSNNTTTLRFQWKTCDFFFVQITWFCTPLWFRYENIIPCVEFGLFYFLYSKTSVQNSFVQCPIVFVCDLWPDLWPVTCTLAPPAERGHADMSQDWLACFQ